MRLVDNTLFSVMVQPVTNEHELHGSILPDRFVSESHVQRGAIVGEELNSSVRINRFVRDGVMQPELV